MSVLACDRSGCEAIMCDFYSNAFGYICRNCLSELNELRPRSFVEIQSFMKTYKQTRCGHPSLDVYEIFERRY